MPKVPYVIGVLPLQTTVISLPGYDSILTRELVDIAELPAVMRLT